jgi:hypothetical protein
VPERAARAIERLRPYGFLILYALIFTGLLGDIVLPIQRAIRGWLV